MLLLETCVPEVKEVKWQLIKASYYDALTYILVLSTNEEEHSRNKEESYASMPSAFEKNMERRHLNADQADFR